jgi:hypothetical protein
MNARRRFVASCCFAISWVVACTSVDRTAPGGSAGSAGEGIGGASAGGSSSGTGATAGDVAAGGHDTMAGGSAGSAGSSSAGTSAGGSAAGGSGGDTTDGGTAGTGMAAAGEAGATATPPQPLLKNGSFEAGGLAPWQIVVTPTGLKGIFTQYPTGGGPSIDGMTEVAFWDGTTAYTGDLHQTVTGLTPGKYELKLYVAYGTGINAAYIYALNCGPSLVRVDLPLADGVASFAPVSIPSIDVTGDSCTVGLFADMNPGDWLNADDFVFDALPTP